MYFYKAYAFGLGGILSRPDHATIETRGSTVLSASGGSGQERLENVQVGGVVSARLVQCEVVGSYDEIRNAHACSATVVIEGLNILNVVTADRVVARVASFQSETAEEPAITAKGSYFEKLRIAGDSVALDLDTDVFDQYRTFSDLEKGFRAHDSGPHSLAAHIHGSNLDPGSRDGPASLRELGEQAVRARQSPATPRWFSLVGRVQGVEPESRNYGSVIYVPTFGVIHLAELLIDRYSRRLNMIRVEMGSPREGHLVFACAEAGTTDIGEGRPMKGRPK